MKVIKARLVKGMRDFPPEEMVIREQLIGKIVVVLKKFGLLPIETPALEFYDLLTAKSGAEATALTYRLIDRGGRELGLRYDLTVPLSRFMAMNPQLPSPFKRYQIQKVWRAEKPQRGRFREFLQCDFDILNSGSIYADAEITAILHECFKTIGITDAIILINTRKLLKEIFLAVGIMENQLDQASRIIDKVDKIGPENVLKEFKENNFDSQWIKKLEEFIQLVNQDKSLDGFHLPWFNKNVEESFLELKDLYNICIDFGVPSRFLRICPMLARGLDYYTGPIFEVHLEENKIGSLAGGGRYDNLVGYFCGRSIPAVGASLGLDRIITVLKERSLVSTALFQKGVLVGIFDESFIKDSLQILKQLRDNDIQSEIIYKTRKLKKQLELANKNKYKVFCFRGPEELENKMVVIKNLSSGYQKTVSENELVPELLRMLRE